MAADAASASTVKSTFFHPQHLLHYSEAASSSSTTHPCAACNRAVTGAGYTCAERGFYVHEACLLALPESVSLDGHTEHPLTLTRLLRATGQRCDVCRRETSDAGSCIMYRCAQCDVNVHPQCATTLLAAAAAADGGQPAAASSDPATEVNDKDNNTTSSTQSRRRKIAKFLLKTTARLAMDVATGGVASSVLDIAVEVMEFAEPALTASFDLAAGNEDNVSDMMFQQTSGSNNGDDNATNSRGRIVAKMVLKTGGRIALNLATGGLASAVLDFWEALS